MSFTVRGCRVRISFYFFVMLALASAVPDSSGTVAAGMIAALIHECGHLIAIGGICRASIESVRLDPLGMSIKTEAADVVSNTLPAAVLSGAAANLLAAGVLLAARMIPGCSGVDKLIGANICLAAVNLLPAQPLDGGQFLSSVLTKRIGAFRAESVCFAVSIAAITAMTAAGIFILLRSRYNYTMLFMALWLFAVVIKDYLR